jgi:PleD family two-component response regulator
VTQVVSILERETLAPSSQSEELRRKQAQEPRILPESSAVPEDRPVQAFGKEQQSRILLVDSNLTEARLLRRLFEARQRFEVLEAPTGKEAMDTIEETTPDLVIMDMTLPDMNGEQLLGILRTRDETRSTPIIIVTGEEVDPATRSRLAMHVDSIWAKSTLDRSIFLAYVESILPE